MSNAYQYLALGDSLTVGVGSTRGGFVPPYRFMAEQALQRPVHVHKLAHSGFTTKELYRLAETHRNAIAKADIITITAGGNDFLQSFMAVSQTNSIEPAIQASERACACLHALVAFVTDQKRGSKKPYIIRVFNTYNPFGSIPLLDQYLSKFNRSLYTLEQNRHVKVVDVYRAFQGNEQRFLSRDGVHPNQEGYDVMALLAAKTGFKPL
ncbi:lysophospholipase L1-like esterase [Alkalihalobacillus xiaoxiensis]|uniref:Lysophospholipase L1-like esterase n=1 Tax=Shouchella xiaoxiensis TaxID=766895 RepID=A0ABS2SPH3_9BACI|nr:GDSL-type esterase/lipase family protein [Shouchella xiaoxiensis]MBM7837424.1 lysophospholipase L1-like esterase [Shouchella xiaoxiensis]